MNLIEGADLPAKRQAHLQTCPTCREAFVSAQNFHSEMMKSALEENEQDVQEPDWFQFRADVRNTMLSRAAQRQSKATSWSGWLLRPAMTWGLVIAFVAGLSAGLFIWNRPGAKPDTPQTSSIESVNSSVEQVASLNSSDTSNIPDDVSLDPSTMDSGISTWSQTSVFEELSQLSDMQMEKLQQLLETDAQQAPAKQ